MPGFDKTGPTGSGPETGGKRGMCNQTEKIGGQGQGGRGPGCRRAGGEGRGLGQGGGRGRRQGQANTTADKSQNSEQK